MSWMSPLPRLNMKQTLKIYRQQSESAALSDEKFRQGIINSVDYLVSKTNLIVAESQFLAIKIQSDIQL